MLREIFIGIIICLASICKCIELDREGRKLWVYVTNVTQNTAQCKRANIHRTRGCDAYQCLKPFEDTCPKGIVKFNDNIYCFNIEPQGHPHYPGYTLTSACNTYWMRSFSIRGFYYTISFYCPHIGDMLPENICIIFNDMFHKRMCLNSTKSKTPPEFDVDIRGSRMLWQDGTKEDQKLRLTKRASKKKQVVNKEKIRYGILLSLICLLLIFLLVGFIIMKRWSASFNEQMGNVKEKVQGFIGRRSSFHSIFSRSVA
ncbi:hypothetical protein SNEBB_007215 [Seison nebaliae]|nr:hypothetical protein SNEBB_007215 [Seison nebaliae]